MRSPTAAHSLALTRRRRSTFFSIQSVSKAITYAMILEEHGEEKVHYHIGREPSGVGFNERVLAAPTPDTGRRLPHK